MITITFPSTPPTGLLGTTDPGGVNFANFMKQTLQRVEHYYPENSK